MPSFTFRCPCCGSSKFGSMQGETQDDPMIRFCHGLNGQQHCGFSWPEADDWKYMLVDGAKLDEVEFGIVDARIRNTPVEAVGLDGKPWTPNS